LGKAEEGERSGILFKGRKEEIEAFRNERREGEKRLLI